MKYLLVGTFVCLVHRKVVAKQCFHLLDRSATLLHRFGWPCGHQVLYAISVQIQIVLPFAAAFGRLGHGNSLGGHMPVCRYSDTRGGVATACLGGRHVGRLSCSCGNCLGFFSSPKLRVGQIACKSPSQLRSSQIVGRPGLAWHLAIQSPGTAVEHPRVVAEQPRNTQREDVCSVYSAHNACNVYNTNSV